MTNDGFSGSSGSASTSRLFAITVAGVAARALAVALRSTAPAEHASARRSPLLPALDPDSPTHDSQCADRGKSSGRPSRVQGHRPGMNAWRIDGARIRQTTKEGGGARPAPPCHTALAALLARSDIDLVGAATTAGTAETLVQEHQPTCSCWRSTCRKGSKPRSGSSRADDLVPELTVIVLSGNEDRCVIDAALDCGASAYVLKSAEPEEIGTAIRRPSSRLSTWRGRRAGDGTGRPTATYCTS